MPEITGVRFKKAGKVYYFDPAGIDLKAYDYVVVQTARGVEMGQVTIAPKQVTASEVTAELKPIVRKASPEDVKRAEDYAAKEESAMAECAKLITKLNLPMKLVTAEYNLDGTRLTFYFTADERVDFRELVRESTAYFKTRIELRQIGPRDQAKMVGGLGRCGRPLCCGSFLTEFSPVSIKMAKEQDLPLDPMKISGVCGRLQCCLSYESQQYHDAKAAMPRKGQQVETPSGIGFISGVFPLKETVIVEFESQASAEFPVSQLKIIEGGRKPEAPVNPQPNEEPAAPPVVEAVKPQPPVNPPAPAEPQAQPDKEPAAEPKAKAPEATPQPEVIAEAPAPVEAPVSETKPPEPPALQDK